MWPSRGLTLVAAHPDDEVLGAGGRLAELGMVTLVHVTDGAPRDMRDARTAGFDTREAYALARRTELDRALVAARASLARHVMLGVADQETPFQLAALVRELIPILEQAECVITHPYEGGHPDHDAAAFAVQAACRRLERSRGHAPRRLEFPSYHALGQQISRGVFWHDQERKRAALAEYVSQRTVIAEFPIEAERLRSAPQYDFRVPPPGTALYDRLDWSIGSAHWRCEAARALAALDLE